MDTRNPFPLEDALSRPTVPCYLSLGSNLGNRKATLRSATIQLLQVEGIELEAVSSLYETSPVGGPSDQPEFLNAVILLRTGLQPHTLLEICQKIEDAHGRVRNERWGARTLDIDILTWNSRSLETHELTLPHPQMYERLFVLEPLLEIGIVDKSGVDVDTAVRHAKEIRAKADQVVKVIEDRRWWTHPAQV